MKAINIINYQGFTEDFLDIYLSNGLGSAPKREIDILVMNLLMKYADLSRESNHYLSILLQLPESRVKRLRYEARLKYPPDTEYIQREFLFVLANAQFEGLNRDEIDIENVQIIFVMEDNYLRYAIQGRLKEKGMFADTSFNSEIIKIKCGSLVNVIEEFYDKKTAEEFLEGFRALTSDEFDRSRIEEVLFDFILGTAKSFLTTLAIAGLKTRLGIP
jgi:hypothetical protein